MAPAMTATFMVGLTPEVLARWADPLGALTPVERARAGRFRLERDSSDFVAAHLLARECAAARTNRSPAEVVIGQTCTSCNRTGHGRPSVAGEPHLGVSLSHSRGVVAAAACRGRIGVDVERRGRACPDERLLASVLTPGERAQLATASEPSLAFLRLWVRKEALVKLGEAQLDRLDEVDVIDLGSAAPIGRAGWTVRQHVDEHAVAAVVWRG